MNTVRVALTSSVLLAALAVAAVAWAGPDTNSGSGGARANGVVPSGGGGSAPAQDSQQSGGTPGENALPDPTTIEQVPPPVTTPQVPLNPQQSTDTEPDEELIVPLEDEDATTTPSNSGGTPAEQTDSGGGGFGFLASTGFELASLVTVGAGMVVAGLAIRKHRRVKTTS
jgi:hypothetical protein